MGPPQFLDTGFILDKKIGVGQPKRIENARILVGGVGGVAKGGGRALVVWVELGRSGCVRVGVVYLFVWVWVSV